LTLRYIWCEVDIWEFWLSYRVCAKKVDNKGANPLLVFPTTYPKGVQGTGSLEEQAYRRSTLLAALDSKVRGDHIPPGGALYAPNIQVFRDSEGRSGYQFWSAPRRLAFCLVSRPTGNTTVFDEGVKAVYVATLRSVLNIGLAKGHDTIVFSAFGCKSNATPRQAVAAVILDVIGNEFASTYKYVTFVSLEDETCEPRNLNPTLKELKEVIALWWCIRNPCPHPSSQELQGKGAEVTCCK